MSVDHCRDVPNNILSFRNKWNGVSGIYKITFLPFRLFTYYGSSSNLGMRFKYHYFNGPKLRNYLGFFLKTFGWTNFAITVIEVCPKDKLGSPSLPATRMGGREGGGRKGILNPFYRKGPGIKALDIAAEKAGTKIYVYDITKFSLVNNKPFLLRTAEGAVFEVRQKFYLFQLTHYLKNLTRVNHLKVITITVNR